MRQKNEKFQTNQITIVFMGTPEFSVPSLDMLYEVGYNIPLVVTQPDKPAGRGQKMRPSFISQKATSLELTVYKPESLKSREAEQKIKECNPDVIVVVAYGKLIPKSILDIPKYGCVNIHPSLLPELRGPSPIQTAISRRLQKTGISIMLLDEGMDSGPILSQKVVDLSGNETAGELHDRLSHKGAEELVTTLPDYIQGNISLIEQIHDSATFTKKIEKQDAWVDFTRSSECVDAHIRSVTPWPGAYAFLKKDVNDSKQIRVKFVKGSFVPDKKWNTKDLGRIIKKDKNICIVCGRGFYVIGQIQLPGKKVQNIQDVVNGNTYFIGSVFV